MAAQHGETRAKQRTRASRRSISVRVRILVAILAVSAVGLAGTGAASYLVQRDRALSAVDAQLVRVAPALKAIAARAGSGSTPSSAETILRTAMQQLVPTANESVLGIVNYAPTFVPSSALPFHLEKDSRLVKRLVQEASATSVVLGTAKSVSGTLRYVIIPVNAAPQTTPGYYVAAVNLNPVLADVALSFRTFVLAALIALVLVGLVAWFVAGRLLRPLRQLRDVAAANSVSNLSARIPVRGHDDISELAMTMNGMFARLERSFASQRRLIDDVRHELKTPITIIRGNLELLDPGDPVDIESTRQLALEELARMNGLVSELSELAESDVPDFATFVHVDIGSLISMVATKARLLDPARMWPVTAGAPGSWVLDPVRITQAWLQLADNAAKYSTGGTPIAITSGVSRVDERHWLMLSVRDTGPGIPVESQQRIFERFGRLESAKAKVGSGLGLSIVLAIAEAHGGRIELNSEQGSGSTFTIKLPVLEPTGAREGGEDRHGKDSDSRR